MKINFTIGFLILWLSSYGQDHGFTIARDNMVNFPSPKAWSFTNYGNYPVSLYTGTLEVPVDLFSFTVNDLPIDVRLTYNFLENKPSTIPSECGLGFKMDLGGVITRVLKSLPDDRHGFYFNGGNLDVYGLHRDIYLNDVLSRIIDPEPDLYYFKFGKYSGSFTFDKNQNVIQGEFTNLKITPILDGYNFAGFEVVTDVGIAYEFLTISKSTYKSGNPTNLDYYNSAWFLSKITFLNNQTVDFEYYPNPFTFPDGNFLTSYYKSETDGVSVGMLPQSLESHNSQTTTHFERYLKSVSFPTGKIEVGITSRTDRGGSNAKKISSLKLLNRADSVIKQYEFEYIENTTERLKLKKIYEGSGINRQLHREFFYNGTNKLPWNNEEPNYPYFSNQIDYWGYYNGQASNDAKNLIPETLLDGNLFGQAIREPNAIFAKAEILTKVGYPTGGFTEFEYELHDFSSQGESYEPRKNVSIDFQSYSFDYDDGAFQVDPYQINFTIANITSVRVSKSIRGGGPNTRWIANSNQTYEEYDLTLNPGTYNLGTLLNANYLFHFDNTDVLMASGRVTFYSLSTENIGPTSKGFGGGLRISKIVNNDGVSSQSKRYVYKNTLTDVGSSGILSKMPSYAIRTNDLIGNVIGYFASSTPILSYNESEIIGYGNVYEINNDGSYKSYVYTTINDYPDDVADYELVFVDPLLFPTVSNRDLRGKLSGEYFYTSDSKLIKSVNYEYSVFADSRTKNMQYVLVNPTFPLLVPVVGGDVGATRYDRLSATMNSLYTKNFWFNKLTSQTTSYHNAAGSSTSSQEFGYNNELHSYQTIIKTTNSKGGIIRNYLSYPQDYQTSFSGLINKNIVGIPVESVNTVMQEAQEKVTLGYINQYNENGKLLSFQQLNSKEPLSNFKFSNRSSGVFPPAGTKTIYLPDSRYELRLEVIQYDTYGNPLEVKKQEELSIVYLWGYGGQYPVAKIENATYAEVLLALGGGSVATNKINALNSPDVSDATIKSTLDSLRNHTNMRKAQVSSYTYKPLVGMTSMTDPRGITEYYKYDGFQRLKDVLDFESNVLKNYQYHYRP